MINLLRNKAFRGLSLSTFFQVIGISFFNIVLLLMAKNTKMPSFWVSLVSIATVLPGITSIFLGRISGGIRNKTKWVILLTLTQSLFFGLLAILFFTTDQYIAVAILVNLLSDIIGIVISLMKMPIIQNKVSGENQQQAMGMYQSISLIIEPVGQAIGVSYIMATHNYVVGSIINAITFLISAFILFIHRKYLTYEEKNVEEGDNHKIKIRAVLNLFSDITEVPIFNILLSIILVNALGTSIDGILNLYILDNPTVSPFSFGTTILLINITFVLGSILGSITVNDILKKASIKTLITLAASIIFLLYVVLLLNLNVLLILIAAFSITYITGKVNPKLYALLMKNSDSKSLSIILGLLNSVLTVAAPLGSVILVGGYPIFGKLPILLLSMVVSIAVVILIQKSTGPRLKK